MASSNIRTLDLPWQSLTVINTTETFLPGTPWMEATDLGAARGFGEARDKNGTGLQWALAYQTANDPRTPDAHVKITTLTGTAGMIDPEQVSLAITGKRFIRGGFAVIITSGTGCIRIGGRIEFIKT